MLLKGMVLTVSLSSLEAGSQAGSLGSRSDSPNLCVLLFFFLWNGSDCRAFSYPNVTVWNTKSRSLCLPPELQKCLHMGGGKEGILQSHSALFGSTECIFMFSYHLGVRFRKMLCSMASTHKKTEKVLRDWPAPKASGHMDLLPGSQTPRFCSHMIVLFS